MKIIQLLEQIVAIGLLQYRPLAGSVRELRAPAFCSESHRIRKPAPGEEMDVTWIGSITFGCCISSGQLLTADSY